MTEEAELQDDVIQSAVLILRVDVCSPTPKLSPVTVTDAYPLCGAFRKP